jgi:hypothetical protein
VFWVGSCVEDDAENDEDIDTLADYRSGKRRRVMEEEEDEPE